MTEKDRVILDFADEFEKKFIQQIRTRTNLLILKEKSKFVVNSISILKARRQALIKEFLNISVNAKENRTTGLRSLKN